MDAVYRKANTRSVANEKFEGSIDHLIFKSSYRLVEHACHTTILNEGTKTKQSDLNASNTHRGSFLSNFPCPHFFTSVIGCYPFPVSHPRLYISISVVS